MKLKKLFEEMTTKPRPYTTDKVSGDYYYYFEVGENEYKVMIGADTEVAFGVDFDNLSIKAYEITFGLKSKSGDMELGATNLGNANIIFATVYKILNSFLNDVGPDVLYFSSIKNEGEKSSRRTLYRRSLKNINNNNYWTKHLTMNKYDEFYAIINKNKIPNNEKGKETVEKVLKEWKSKQ